MIISGNGGIGKANKIYGVEQIKSGKGTSLTEKSGSNQSDAVVLSSEAQELQQAVSTIKALPSARMDRVTELSSQVDSGQYKVDAAKIADQMLGRALADQLR